MGLGSGKVLHKFVTVPKTTELCTLKGELYGMGIIPQKKKKKPSNYHLDIKKKKSALLRHENSLPPALYLPLGLSQLVLIQTARRRLPHPTPTFPVLLTQDVGRFSPPPLNPIPCCPFFFYSCNPCGVGGSLLQWLVSFPNSV